jgi:hypothetical protein
MAFETLALKDSLSTLAAIDDPAEMSRLTTVFSGLQELESAHYYQIVKSRVAVLTKLDTVKDKGLEKVVQQHIFDNLWLLDPSWERASTDEGMEVVIGKAFKALDADLTAAQKKARLDIKYRTAAGKNIVIELKKYDRVVDINDLVKQAGKYRGALQKILKKQYQNSRNTSKLFSFWAKHRSPTTPTRSPNSCEQSMPDSLRTMICLSRRGTVIVTTLSGRRKSRRSFNWSKPFERIRADRRRIHVVVGRPPNCATDISPVSRRAPALGRA